MTGQGDLGVSCEGCDRYVDLGVTRDHNMGVSVEGNPGVTDKDDAGVSIRCA